MRAAGVALGLGLLLATAPPSRAAAANGTVAIAIAIEGMAYAPAAQRVRRGERVTWVNKDLVPHTVTAKDGSFHSQAIAPGAAWSYVAVKPGSYAYACDFHPTMSATLVVE